jgi:dihydropteroate synthase
VISPLVPAGRPWLVGIVNITEDSFSDGGRCLAAEDALAEAMASIDRFFAERLAALESAGVARERLIIDPGLGYFLGSNPEPSLTVLAGLGWLKARFGVPVLVSPSRKSFLRTVTGRDLAKIGAASLAAELYAAGQGADYIRTHDVAALADGLSVLGAIGSRAVEPAAAGPGL